MIKKPKSTLDQFLMVKKTKSSTKKNLGIGSPVICIFIVTPYPITQALRYGQDRSKEERWVGCIGSYYINDLNKCQRPMHNLSP